MIDLIESMRLSTSENEFMLFYGEFKAKYQKIKQGTLSKNQKNMAKHILISAFNSCFLLLFYLAPFEKKIRDVSCPAMFLNFWMVCLGAYFISNYG